MHEKERKPRMDEMDFEGREERVKKRKRKTKTDSPGGSFKAKGI